MTKYEVTASSLNVRQEPRLTATVIGGLRRGEVVDVQAESGDRYWLQFPHGNGSGWAAQKYLRRTGDGGGGGEFPWMDVAVREIGTREFDGAADNPRVVDYLRSTTLGGSARSNDETPWCSAFTNWCVEKSGFAGTDSAWARSWLNWGTKTSTPRRGVIAVFSRGADQGHVGFFVGQTATHVRVVGGNQSNAVNESDYPKSRLLSYRIPV